MWPCAWFLILFLDLSSAEYYLFGLKHVKATADTCAVIIARKLRSSEVEFRREKVSAPCFDGPPTYNVILNQENAVIWMCHIKSGLILVCFENQRLGFTFESLNVPLTHCGFSGNGRLNILIKNYKEVDVFDGSSYCSCTDESCEKTGPSSNSTCLVYDAINTATQCPVDDGCDYVSNVAGNVVCRLKKGYLYIQHKGTEYFQLPDYDFLFGYSLDIMFPKINYFYLNHVKIDAICTISVRDAFETLPLYYFDTGRMVDGVFERECFGEGAKFHVRRFTGDVDGLTTKAEQIMYGCFLHSEGSLQCGIFVNFHFVLVLEAKLDVQNVSTADYNLFVNYDEYSTVWIWLCPKQPVNAKCFAYKLEETLSPDITVVNGTVTGEEAAFPVVVWVSSIDGRTVWYSKDGSRNILYLPPTWDAIFSTFEKSGVMFKRVYGINYLRRMDECSLEYRHGESNHFIREASIPCMPEDALKLLHVTYLDGVYFVEACYYHEGNHSIVCSDHYTNSTSIYSLNRCHFKVEGKPHWIFGYLQNLYIGTEHGGCIITRNDDGQYGLTKGLYQFPAGDNTLVFKLIDPFTKIYVGIRTEHLYDVSYFEHVCGIVVFQNASGSYDGMLVPPKKRIGDFNQTFYLTNTEYLVYISGPDARYPDCGGGIRAVHAFVILGIDLILLLLFVAVYFLEMKGYVRMKYQEIRDELMEQKRTALEAIGRVLF